MRIRLVRKLASAIDGVDISDYAVGDVIDLPAGEARLLLAEGWARREIRRSSHRAPIAEAADSTRVVVERKDRREKHHGDDHDPRGPLRPKLGR
jgi:hypothetical protein